MKKFISLLLTIVLICSSLPMYVGAEETTGGYKLEYERIGEDTYKVYIIADKASLDIHELRVQYGDAEIVSYEWYKQFAEKYEGVVIASDVIAHKYISFPCAFLSDKNITDEMEYFGEVVIKITPVNQSISLLDETGTILYDEIALDMSTEWDGSTPRPVPGTEAQPTATWNPEWTPVPTAPPTEAPTETPESTPEPNYETGDVDGNGNINAQDALLVLKYAAKLGELSEAQFKAANVDDNNNVNATDALNILKYAAKIIVRFVFNPDDNIRVLRDYIIENGTVNKNGNKEFRIDYVANGELDFDIAYDSLEYDAGKDCIIYVCETVDEVPENCMKIIITLNNTTDTSVEVEWKQATDNEVVDIKGNSIIKNEEYSLESNFKEDMDSTYLGEKVPSYSSYKKNVWVTNMKKAYNGYVHVAFATMEEFLSKTLVMYISDIYQSYRYSDEKFFEVTAPIYGIDYSVYENIRKIKKLLDIKGTRDGQYVYIKESYTEEQNTDVCFYDVYLEKDTESDSLYFILNMYHANDDTPVIIYLYPFANKEVYADILFFEQNKSGEYEVSKEFYTITNSYEMDQSKSYEYTCVYPENSSITKSEQEMIDRDICRLLMKIEMILHKKTTYELFDLGFTYF